MFREKLRKEQKQKRNLYEMFVSSQVISERRSILKTATEIENNKILTSIDKQILRLRQQRNEIVIGIVKKGNEVFKSLKVI